MRRSDTSTITRREAETQCTLFLYSCTIPMLRNTTPQQLVARYHGMSELTARAKLYMAKIARGVE